MLIFHYLLQISWCSDADYSLLIPALCYMPTFYISVRPMRFLVREGRTPWVIPRPAPSAPQERCVQMLTVLGSRPVSRGPTPWPGRRPVWTVLLGTPVLRLTPLSRSSVSREPTHWPRPRSVHRAPQGCKYITYRGIQLLFHSVVISIIYILWVY